MTDIVSSIIIIIIMTDKRKSNIISKKHKFIMTDTMNLS